MLHASPAIAVLVSAAVARASEGPPPILNIKTYVSPSGEHQLTVDPSQLHGQGPGSYRLVRAGKELWSKEFDFTFWEAGVTRRAAYHGTEPVVLADPASM